MNDWIVNFDNVSHYIARYNNNGGNNMLSKNIARFPLKKICRSGKTMVFNNEDEYNAYTATLRGAPDWQKTFIEMLCESFNFY